MKHLSIAVDTINTIVPDINPVANMQIFCYFLLHGLGSSIVEPYVCGIRQFLTVFILALSHPSSHSEHTYPPAMVAASLPDLRLLLSDESAHYATNDCTNTYAAAADPIKCATKRSIASITP